MTRLVLNLHTAYSDVGGTEINLILLAMYFSPTNLWWVAGRQVWSPEPRLNHKYNNKCTSWFIFVV
jgi:hypothetical protein